LKHLSFPLVLITLTAALTSGCVASASQQNDNNTADGSHVTNPDGSSNNNQNNNNQWFPPLNSRVYVNTQDTLYFIDPGQSQQLVAIGDFTGPCTSGSGLYDIAVDEDKNIIGIAAEGLYEVDKDTAQCTMAVQFDASAPHFFSLSYVKGVDPQDPDADKLVAASVEEGEWVLIDYPGGNPSNLFIHLGYHDPQSFIYRSSGDIVSIQVGAEEYITYATLKCENYTDPGCETDWLAEINPENGYATLIGQTGYQRIFGLGFWGDTLYGFTADGEYILMDTDTGAGTLVQNFAFTFWGAGNTTRPHVVR
jgi:hypothetical protein